MAAQTDSIFIHNLQIHTAIGAYAWEQAIKQKLIFTIELGCDLSKAAQSDALQDALDYAQIASGLRDLLANQRFQLLEALAEHVAAWLLQQAAVEWVQLSIAKPGAIAECDAVGVSIKRYAI